MENTILHGGRRTSGEWVKESRKPWRVKDTANSIKKMH